MPVVNIDTNTPEGRHAASILGINTLGDQPTSMLPGVQMGMSGSGGTTDLSSDQNDILAAYRESAGFEREKLAEQSSQAKAQLAQQAKQAKATLDFQYAQMKQIAKTAAESLAVDKWYKEQQVHLAEMTHALAVRAEQLSERAQAASEAKTMTEYLSGPDTAFQARQMGRQLAALNAGGTAPSYRAGGDMEQPRTEAGFQGLMGGVASIYGTPMGQGVTGQGAGAGGGSTGQPGAGNGAAADGRVAAATGILKALPPSGTVGMNARDGSAMSAIQALYESPDETAALNEADKQGSAFLARGPGDEGDLLPRLSRSDETESAWTGERSKRVARGRERCHDQAGRG
jgi:hypothetical protein